MPTTYTAVYTAVATNVSRTVLGGALAAQPRDLVWEDFLGISVTSDATTTSLPNRVTRTVIFTDDGSGPIPTGQPLADTMQGFYGASWGRPLGTPVTAAPIVVVE